MIDGDLTPRPDPTVLTTEQLVRATHNLEILLMARIDAMGERIDGEHSLKEEKFKKVEQRFELIEAQRIEQKSDTRAALEAALTAAKEAVLAQDVANQKAIAKSEAATGETLKGLSELFRTTTDALSRRIEDMKERIDRGDGETQGGERVTDNFYARLGVIAILAGLAGHYVH